MHHPRASFKNGLLARLDSADLARLAPHLSHVELTFKMPLVSPNEPIARCYFPESGIASVVTTTADGKQAEIGVVGREGMVDVAAVMGERTPFEIFVQMTGEAFAVPTKEVVALFDESRGFRRLLLGYAHSLLIQASQTALANVALRIEDRLARWLLMNSDRADSPSFPTTHEFLSLMLGVRRAGVTNALSALVTAGYICTSRGQITIIDRKGLEDRARDTYRVPEDYYRIQVEG